MKNKFFKFSSVASALVFGVSLNAYDFMIDDDGYVYYLSNIISDGSNLKLDSGNTNFVDEKTYYLGSYDKNGFITDWDVYIKDFTFKNLIGIYNSSYITKYEYAITKNKIILDNFTITNHFKAFSATENNISYNELIIKNSKFVNYFDGITTKGDAINNEITIDNITFDTKYTSYFIEGDRKAWNNKLTINSGNFLGKFTFIFSRASANNNEIIINGGNFKKDIIVANSYTSVTGNELTINDGDFQDLTKIILAYSDEDTAANANYNTLTLAGGKNMDNVIFMMNTDNFRHKEENKFNFKAGKNFKAKGLYNANILNFELPANIKNNETLFELSEAYNLKGVTDVGLTIAGKADLTALNLNEYVNLVYNESGVKDYTGLDKVTAIAGATKSYDFEILKTANALQAKLVAENLINSWR